MLGFRNYCSKKRMIMRISCCKERFIFSVFLFLFVSFPFLRDHLQRKTPPSSRAFFLWFLRSGFGSDVFDPDEPVARRMGRSVVGAVGRMDDA